MPRFRADVQAISPYRPGRPIADVARELGLDPADIVKLASNESPLPPVSAAVAVMSEAISGVHRYPDNAARDLRAALADHLGVTFDEVWVGAGSSELLRVVATAVGGPETNAVYAWPSFVVYRLATMLAGATPREVPLDQHHVHDLDAMLDAIDPDTTVVYVCNPNNPTGTMVPADAIVEFVERVPDDVMVVLDEAYHEYVTDPSHATSIPLARRRPNVLTLRTFSKIHGLAALRVGYAVGRPETLVELRKAQAPFSVTSVGQLGAIASLGAEREISERIASVAGERDRVESALADLDVEYVPSHANFVYLRLGSDTGGTTRGFLEHGVIVRPFGDGWLRVSIGSPVENDRFLHALASILS